MKNRIKEIRIKHNMTQSELAHKLNMKQGNLSRFESGANTPTIDTLILISKIFNVSIDYLVYNEIRNDNINDILDNIIEYIENIKNATN